MTTKTAPLAAEIFDAPDHQNLAFFERMVLGVRMGFDTLTRRYTDTPWRSIVSIAFATAYLVSPVDLMPEALLGPLGLADDMGVWLLAFKMVSRDVEDYKSWLVRR